MALNELPLAQDGIYRDFEADVLQELVRHRAKLHGCPVEKVECKLDGGVAVWFSGPRDGSFWRGALRFNFPMLRDKKWLGDVTAIVETTLQMLAQISLRDSQPIIVRAGA
jgi:hypothetical protein